MNYLEEMEKAEKAQESCLKDVRSALQICMDNIEKIIRGEPIENLDLPESPFLNQCSEVCSPVALCDECSYHNKEEILFKKKRQKSFSEMMDEELYCEAAEADHLYYRGNGMYEPTGVYF